MTDKVFLIESDNFKSLFLGDEAIMFHGDTIESVDEFTAAWNKKITLSKRDDIKFSAITSITKNDDSKNIRVSYKNAVHIPDYYEFSFLNDEDYETFFTVLEKHFFFKRSNEKLTSFKSIQKSLFGLVLTVALTIFSFHQAIDIEKVGIDENESSKLKLFDKLLKLLGGKGVLLIGAIVTAYFIFKIWKRLNNPPMQLKLTKQNI